MSVIASSAEMNGVPPVEEEPLISYNQIGRDNRRSRKGRCPKCCFPCCVTSMCIFMFVCVIVAAGLGASYKVINKQVDKFIAQKVALTNGSQGTDNWSDPGAAVYMSFYMFNLTNKNAFLNGAKPIVKEIGPFVYNENKTKYDLQWNTDETILEYKENTSYTLNEERCKVGYPKDVNITTINLPLIGFMLQFEKLLKIFYSLPPAFSKPLEDVVYVIIDELEREFSENLIMTRNVDEVVWGYQDKFLKFISDITKNITFIDLSMLPPDGVFQLEKRSSVAGPNMVFTGKYNPSLTAQYIMYDGQTSIPGWGTPYAQMINGTEALLFHPGVKRSDVLEVYVDELFRSGYFEYYEDVTEFGIEMYQYRLPIKELSKRDQDKGFNMYGPDGVLNLTAVFPLNVPVFVSKPHFLDASKIYSDYIVGPPPDREIHDSFLSVEPVTGAVFDAAKRLQINIEICQYDKIDALSKLPNRTYLPLLWVEERGRLNSTLADTFKDSVYRLRTVIHVGIIVVASLAGAVALTLFLASFACLAHNRKRRTAGPLSVQCDQ